MSMRKSLARLRSGDLFTPEGPKSSALRWSDLYRDKAGRIGKQLSKCAEVLGEIQHGETVHIVSMGEWSAEHVICHVAEQIGPCDLLMATWSVSNDAVLRLAQVMEAGHVRSCRALLDWRVKVRRPEALQILRTALLTTDLYLSNCHGKVYLMANDEWAVSWVGSPNLTTNPRIEASVLTEGREVHNFHATWINGCIDRAKPFEAED